MSMKRKTALALLLSALLALSACGSSAQGESGSETSSQSASSQSDSSSAENQELSSQLFSDRDLEIGYDEKQAVNITLTGDSASWDGEGVTADGGTVTITREGVYLLSGTLDGMVVVNVSEEEKVQLVLDGVDISSATSAAIYVSSADKVFITTAADSVNTLENGGEYIAIDDNNIDGVIFAKSDLTLNGAGSLIIQGEAEHGVVTKDDLVVTSGIYDVTVGGHGLSGKDSVAICGGTFTLSTGKDGVQSDNDEDSEKGYVYLSGGDFTIVAQRDGFSASSWMQVDGGVYNVTTGGGSANGEEHTDSMFPDRGGMGGMRGPGGMSGGAPQDGAGQPGTQPFQEGEASSAASQGTTPSSQTMTATPLASNTETAQEEERSDTPSTKGFKAGSWLTIGGGEFQLDCADDAFHSNGDLTFLDGSVELSTGDDAFHAD